MKRDPDQPQDQYAARAARTYGAAADHYLEDPLSFWDRWGAQTVARLALEPGASVLDLCCGAGASALPAAEAVGPAGSVLGLDITEELLALARRRAAERGLDHVAFRHGDATATGIDSGSFDAVVCVFGVFFAADMPGFVREMWRLVRPGGCLAVTTWGPDWCEPVAGIFWDAVRELEPSLFRAFNPWDTITTSRTLGELLASGGVVDPDLLATDGEQHQLREPEDFWEIVLGSGFRGTVDALTAPQRRELRERVVGDLRARGVTAVGNDVVFATAVKR
jgi:ubiquinone/menaquinone biosynthesis C-methylase UbiE